jgi:hypothetical protein
MLFGKIQSLPGEISRWDIRTKWNMKINKGENNKMVERIGFTIDELIEELQIIKMELGGNVRVVMPQVGDKNEIDDCLLEWDANIENLFTEINDNGEMVVKLV